MYRSTKTYGHECGLSACFRQWRATSHCRFIHGYALAFTFVFEAPTLDACNWVIDFGGLRELKHELQQTFDHKLLVAQDDPQMDELCALAGLGVARTLVLPAVGCEAFARIGWGFANQLLIENAWVPRVRVVSCEAREHGANSAIYVHEEGASWGK